MPLANRGFNPSNVPNGPVGARYIVPDIPWNNDKSLYEGYYPSIMATYNLLEYPLGVNCKDVTCKLIVETLHLTSLRAFRKDLSYLTHRDLDNGALRLASNAPYNTWIFINWNILINYYSSYTKNGLKLYFSSKRKSSRCFVPQHDKVHFLPVYSITT
jgi:hypothetical protein